MEDKALEKDILVTLMYSDVFDMPLTAFEIWQYRVNSRRLTQVVEQGVDKVTFSSITEALLILSQKNLIVQRAGMFTLKEREHLISDRIFRMKQSDRKLKRLLRIVGWMRFSPFVRMIAVTGRLATKQIGINSDWDVLVVMEYGHIWVGRLILTIFLGLLGKRRWGEHTKDRICLNHFLTTKSLRISLKDLFAAREYAYMIPVFGEGVFREFEKQNDWIQTYLPEWKACEVSPLFLKKETSRSLYIRGFLEKVFCLNSMERCVRFLQKRKIEKNPKTHLSGAYVVADDGALIFLPKPQGPKVFEKFMNRLMKEG